MKQFHYQPAGVRSQVAPRTGAWIETLKELKAWQIYWVAPRTGAWIETCKECTDSWVEWVAPRTGAWIETSRCQSIIPRANRRAPHGRVD